MDERGKKISMLFLIIWHFCGGSDFVRVMMSSYFSIVLNKICEILVTCQIL